MSRKKTKEKEIDERTKNLIERYREKANSGSLSESTVINTISAVKTFKVFLGAKPLDRVTDRDVDRFFSSERVKTLKESSQGVLKLRLRSFYRYLNGGETPEFVSHLKVRKLGQKSPVKPKDILSEEEVLSMIKTCQIPLERAVISVLYESACRRGELLNLTIGDVIIDDKGAIIQVDGKTGERTIRLIHSVPFLQQWLNHHPQGDDKKNKLFPLWEPDLFSLIKRASKEAGIERRVWVHLFRHSRLTHLAKHLTESELKVFAGWKAHSNMASVYVHLNGHDLDDKLVSIAQQGRPPPREEAEPSPLKPMKCSRCEKENPADALYCNCGMHLRVDRAVKDGLKQTEFEQVVKELVQKLAGDSNFREGIKEALRIAESFPERR